jgi:hypothetical protein
MANWQELHLDRIRLTEENTIIQTTECAGKTVVNTMHKTMNFNCKYNMTSKLGLNMLFTNK